MTISQFKTLAVFALGLSATTLAGACNIEPSAVDQPTYEADVRPILMARCARCHGSPSFGDPQGNPPMQQRPIGTLQFDVYGDTNCDSTPSGGMMCVRGARTAATSGRLKTYLGFPQDQGGMPPLPAPKLTSYQEDTVLNWAAEADPLEK